MGLYSPRVKVYDFGQIEGVNSGSITDTKHPIVGELLRMVVSGDRTAAAGSLFLQTNDLVRITLGSVINTNTTQEIYFSANQQGTDGDTNNRPVVSEILQLSGAGVGTGSLFNVKLYYR